MEKTIKYNLDESYAQGYNDAREEIAKAIEAWGFEENAQTPLDVQIGIEWARDFFAAIARGNN